MGGLDAMFANHREWMGAIAHAEDIKNLAGARDSWIHAFNEKVLELAFLVAQRAALFDQLKKIAPNHPLVTDDELFNKIGAAGEEQMRSTDEWKDVVRVGVGYPIPPFRSSEDSLRSEVKDLELALRGRNSEMDLLKLDHKRAIDAANDDVAAHMAQVAALKAQLARYNPQDPLLTDVELRKRISVAGQVALDMTKNWNAVREAGRTFDLGYDVAGEMQQLREQLAMFDPDNALLSNSALRQKIEAGSGVGQAQGEAAASAKRPQG